MLRDKLRRTTAQTETTRQTTRRRETEPPFQKLATDVIWVAFRIDLDRVRPYLPSEVVLTPQSLGIVGIYQAETGIGLTPYQRGLVAVSVEGVPGSDIGEGMFVIGNIMDEPGASGLRRLYSAETVTGSARTWEEGELWHGAAAVDGEDWLRATVRPVGETMRDLSGVDTFFGLTEAGLIKHADSNVCDIRDAEIVSLEITDAAPDYMRALRPVEFAFGLHAIRVNSIWSEPRVVGRSQANAASVFLSLIEDTGRAAAVVRQDGTLVEANASARSLLGRNGPRPGEALLKGGGAERQALNAALAASCARTGPRVSEPIVINGPGGTSLLAYVLPLEHGQQRSEEALVLLADPHGRDRRDAVQMLQLFGLTAAEARLAALIAVGNAARQAAAALHISEHTARSTMKTIYDKLGIRKQSELGRLVARLQHF